MGRAQALVTQMDLCAVVLEEGKVELLHWKIPHFRLLFLCLGSFDIMKKTRSVEEVDLISELPEGVLNKILSFLPFKEIVQTSVLSTIWEQVWRT
ncbi:hypothetical protein LWI28_028830 [Acer negundo]|uniref:F-box domain-containing protein n=1 Tax=Acer negundo TaxID=4023 RepID=A0AAD5NMG6_ACENE|nr:hypothetical protein LWI28_028830 [Acer negundo]